MKVYVISESDYDEYYCLHGIFSTREKAEDFVNTCGFGDDIDICEWELDTLVGHKLRKSYSEKIDIRTGKSFKFYTEHHIDRSDIDVPNGSNDPVESLEDYRLDEYEGEAWYVAESFISQSHAKKLAKEMREQLLKTHYKHFVEEE